MLVGISYMYASYAFVCILILCLYTYISYLICILILCIYTYTSIRSSQSSSVRSDLVCDLHPTLALLLRH